MRPAPSTATGLLAPFALAIVFFYSLTKRFTQLPHFFLGLALAIAPLGAWIAQTARLDSPPLILGAGVICWVAGFDLIYATQDFEFDRREAFALASREARESSAVCASRNGCTSLMFAALLGFGFASSLGLIYFCAMPFIAAALFYEHRSAQRLDLAGINRAFFQSNAFVSAVFLLAVCAAVWLQ